MTKVLVTLTISVLVTLTQCYLHWLSVTSHVTCTLDSSGTALSNDWALYTVDMVIFTVNIHTQIYINIYVELLVTETQVVSNGDSVLLTH